MSERNVLGALALCVVMMTTMTASLSARATAAPVRGTNINDRISGQATAPTKVKKKLPGKKNPPTLTLKRGKNNDRY